MKNDKMAIITCMILVISSIAGFIDDEDNEEVQDLIDENMDDSMDGDSSTVDNSTVDNSTVDNLSLIHISEPTRPERIGVGGGWV